MNVFLIDMHALVDRNVKLLLLLLLVCVFLFCFVLFYSLVNFKEIRL